MFAHLHWFVVFLCILRHNAQELNSTTSGGALYFLGGAFEKGLRDLAEKPNEWSSVQVNAGYWLHPMGFDAARQKGFAKQLLSRFGVKRYVYEADLMAWTDGTNPTQTNSPWCWGQWLEQIDSSYQQAFFAPWVAGDLIANKLQDVTNRYIDVSNKMKSKGYSNTYFFYAPPSPEAISVVDFLLNGRVDGVPYVQYAIQRAGLKGIAIDYPAGLYLAQAFPSSFPPGSADKCRQLAKQAYQIAKSLNLPFIWVFNGADDNVHEAKQAIMRDGIAPTKFVVDNFAKRDAPGTPESSRSSLSGQVKQLM